MKKTVAALVIAAVTLGILPCGAADSKKYVTAERISAPTAVVYTHWGEEEQTDQKFNYNYVIKSKNTSGPLHLDEPERVLYYRFDLSGYIAEGWRIDSAVLLQDGPDGQRVIFYDCADALPENGQNYLTVPALTEKNAFLNLDYAKANIGTDAVKSLYPIARGNDDCTVDITEYINGKIAAGETEFGYAMFPCYDSTIYFTNHPQLYLKLTKPRGNIVFLHENNSHRLSISGETGENAVSVDVRNPNGESCYSGSCKLGEDETYYHFGVDMSEMAAGSYDVAVTFGGKETVTRTFELVRTDSAAGIVYASVDYGTQTVRIHGRMNRTDTEPVMLTIFKPDSGAADSGEIDIDYSALDPDSVYYMGAATSADGQYEFKVGMSGAEGSYTAVVSGVAGSVGTSFTYYPTEAREVDNGIDRYTTTYYAPWLLNWHMTKKMQLDAGYYGGEACQMNWALEISPSDSNMMFAGTDTNGLWRSTDGGKSWRSVSAGFNSMGVVDIAVDPEDGKTVYALAGTGVGRTEKKGDGKYTGIYRSMDGGDTWERIFANSYHRISNNRILRFGKRGADGKRRIFAGGHGYAAGAVYSDNDGETWNALAGGALAELVTRDIVLFDTDVDGGDSQTVVFGTSGGIFISTNGGDTVAERSPIAGESFTVTVDPKDGGHWIAGSGQKLYETTDSGESWTEVYTFSEESGRLPGVAAVRYGYGENPRLYVLIGPAHFPLRYSTDNGRSFVIPEKAAESTEFIKDNRGWGAEPFALDRNDPDTVIASFDGEIYKSTDGGDTYFASSSGYSGMRASDFLFSDEDDSDIFITSIDRGIVRTVNLDKGEQYPIVDYDPSEDGRGIRYNGSKTMTAVARDPKDSNRIIVCVGGGGKFILKQSFDGGKTFTAMNGTENTGVGLIEFNADNNKTIYAGNLVSYDDGASWSALEKTVLAVSLFDGNTVYSTTGGFAARSEDEGRTWTAYGGSIGAECMICDAFEKDVLYVGSYSGLTKILSDGTPVNITPKTDTSAEGTSFYGLAVAQDPKNRLHLVAGGTDNISYGRSGGLFETFDGGETWRRINGMPAARDIWTLEFHPSLPRVYIGTSAGTFVYEYEKYTDEKIAVTDKWIETAAREGEDGIYDVTYSLRLWNTQDRAYDAAVMVAVCDKESGRVLDAAAVNRHINATDSTEVTITLSAAANTALRAFVWSDSLTPLNTGYDYIVIENDSGGGAKTASDTDSDSEVRAESDAEIKSAESEVRTETETAAAE